MRDITKGHYIVFVGLLFISTILITDCQEIDYSKITVVENNTGYLALFPNATFDIFNAIKHVKGNLIFNKGQRIPGDRLLLNHCDNDGFEKPEDVEVWIRFPSVGEGPTISFIEVLVDLDDTAQEYFTGIIEGTGGINKKTFEMLIKCKPTSRLVYEIFIYGW